MGNALAFCPARSAYPSVRLEILPEAVRVSASDAYTIGVDHVQAETDGQALACLQRADAQTLERAARSERGQDVTLTIGLGEAEALPVQLATNVGLPLLPAGTTGHLPDPHVRVSQLGHGASEADLYSLIDGLIGRLDGREDPPGVIPWPCDVALDLGLLSAFAKVRHAGPESQIGDLRMWGSEEPILVKVGATFRGAIMPHIRDATPQAMLW